MPLNQQTAPPWWMVVVLGRWLTALVSSQCVFFLCEETYDKLDNKFFASTLQN
jgi:hypothetical protein